MLKELIEMEEFNYYYYVKSINEKVTYLLVSFLSLHFNLKWSKTNSTKIIKKFKSNFKKNKSKYIKKKLT